MPSLLVLVPTDLERRRLAPRLAPLLEGSGRMELCGFGPIAAAARTAALLAAARPNRVLLVGIAGRLADRLEIGRAYRFAEVACHGIGAGSGRDFQPAGELGWPQWPGDPPAAGPAVGDVLPLAGPAGGPSPPAGMLLTACAASATAADAACRREAWPAAAAEDMEGFGVALACRLAGLTPEIVRGISNTAGDRDTARWAIEPALAAAAELVAEILASSRPEPPR